MRVNSRHYQDLQREACELHKVGGLIFKVDRGDFQSSSK